MQRAETVLRQYAIAVFRVIPMIVAACAVVLVFVDGPQWRGALVTTIAMMSVILPIDSNANARLQVYQSALEQAASAQDTD